MSFLKRLGILLFLACLAESAMAGSVSLYLNNQPYNKPVFTYKGQVFVSLEDIASALNLKLVQQGRVLCAATSDYTGPSCPSAAPSALLYLNGKPVMTGVSLHHGKAWISLGALANPLGYYYDYNPGTGIADLAAPSSVSSSLSSSSEEGASGGGEKSGSKTQTTSKDPLKVSITCPGMCYPDPTTYEVRLSFTVTNASDQAVNGIVATLEYRDKTGKAANSQTYSIGTLDAGKSVTEDGYWIDAAEIPIQPHVDLDWDGKPKE